MDFLLFIYHFLMLVALNMKARSYVFAHTEAIAYMKCRICIYRYGIMFSPVSRVVEILLQNYHVVGRHQNAMEQYSCPNQTKKFEFLLVSVNIINQ